MPTVSANSIDLYYERQGAGPRLLFFNGSGATLAVSGPLIWSFADRFDVVAHDQRGLGRHGDSAGAVQRWPTMRPTRRRCSITSAGRPAASIGVSFGGMVAQELAVTWPRARRAPGAGVHVAGR